MTRFIRSPSTTPGSIALTRISLGPSSTARDLTGEVYQILMSKPGVFPGMDEDDVRRSLALEYLKTTRMSTDDLAMLPGFSDAANFRRALKRWTGKGPGELRS